MGRTTSPKLKRELANLEKDDSETRKSAMKVLKSYVTNMNPSSIPQFISQVSASKDLSHNNRSDNYTISLYEVLARAHGPNIVPHIGNIMAAILETLSHRSASISLHQACAKVVISLARYSITPETPPEKKKNIIISLCKPLSDSLLGSQESLSSGSALCLGALVDSDNWRFSSNDMVNEVCLRATGCLEDKPKQTNSHMSLVMSLAKRNPLVVEAYSRLLIKSGLRILNAGVAEGSSQKRLSAIQMVNFLLKWLDPQSVLSELDVVAREMDKCSSDRMAFVKGAAFEALLTALSIARGSSSGARGPRRSLSPESGSFAEHGSPAVSPIFPRRISRELEDSAGGWLLDSGGVDVSLKDGLFSAMGHAADPDWRPACSDGPEARFVGFAESCSDKRNADDVAFGTPRRLLTSLQDEEDGPEEQQGFDHPPPSWYESSPEESEDGEKASAAPPPDRNMKGSAESVSSTDNAGRTRVVPEEEMGRAPRPGTGCFVCRGRERGSGFGLLCGVAIAASTVLASIMFMDGGSQGVALVPT